MGLVVPSAEAEGFGNELRNYSDSLVEKLESWGSFSLKWIEGERDMINEEKIVSVHLSHTAESGHDGNERQVMPEHEKASLLPPWALCLWTFGFAKWALLQPQIQHHPKVLGAFFWTIRLSAMTVTKAEENNNRER